MKSLIFVCVFVLNFASAFAASKTPEAALNAFHKMFPGATAESWDQESAHNYEVAFVQNNVHYSANFNEKGEWLETETPSSFEQLPNAVQTAFQQDHPGVKAGAVAKIETAQQGVIYEVEVKNGLKVKEYFFKADGSTTSE